MRYSWREVGHWSNGFMRYQWRTFVEVALVSGCRRAERLALTWDRVDFVREWLVITNTKSNEDRLQSLPSYMMARLRKLQETTLADGGPFVSIEHRIADHFQDIVAKAGILHCVIHDLRKTFCTDLARAGVNQLIVQRLAGHASAATTAKYYQTVDAEMKREVLEKLRRPAAG